MNPWLLAGVVFFAMGLLDEGNKKGKKRGAVIEGSARVESQSTASAGVDAPSKQQHTIETPMKEDDENA